MTIRIDKADIWYWHNVFEQYHALPYDGRVKRKAFCEQNNYDLKAFISRYMRIIYISRTRPKFYAKLLALGKEYLKLGDRNPSSFCKEHHISIKDLSNVTTHIKYLDILEEIKKEKGIMFEPGNTIPFPQPRPSKDFMDFIKIPEKAITPIAPIVPAPTPEVLEPKNDIEITISKGVKVCVSPSIDSTKIMKIIELLKDL